MDRQCVPFEFWGDNVDKKRSVRDVRSDNQGDLLHMYSMLAGCSRTARIASTLNHRGHVAKLSSISSESLLPTSIDVEMMRQNLVVLVGCLYIDGLKPLSKAVPSHITHQYSKEMASVVVVDVLFRNEASSGDMIDIMTIMHQYLGSDYQDDRQLLSGGDQLTIERQIGSQHHRMDGDTVKEQLSVLEPVTEDWHCMVCLLSVGSFMQ